MSRFSLQLATALALLAPLQARADYHVQSPAEIDLGELEIEHNGSASFDRLPANSGAQSYTLELGTGLTSWWHSEIEFGFDRDPGGSQPTLLTQLVSENMFQLTEPGEYWADWGFYAEYGQSTPTKAHAGANEVTFGPAIAKDIGHTTSTVNLFLTRQLGPDQTTQGLDFSYAWQTRWNVWEALSPAVEIYGDAGVLGSNPRFSQQQLLVGPVAIGAVKLNDLGLGHAGKLKYELGWLFGATQASPSGTLRWRLEVEIPF
jgi:hypothetical protein